MENDIQNNQYIEHLNSYLDYACHRANTVENDVRELCKETIAYGFNSSFINPCYVGLAKSVLHEKAKVGTVVSFPLGQDIICIKIAALKQVLCSGADEIDVVLNIGSIKEHHWERVYAEMEALTQLVKNCDSKKIIKFIPETGYLTADEIKTTAELMVRAGVDFFKTCSGHGPRGATLEDIALIRSAVGDDIKIKVAGGVSTYEKAVAFIEAGADRIGTSSAVAIIQEAHNYNK